MSRILTFKDLAAAADKIDITDESAKRQWRNLYYVYTSALDNPPNGVIGVGAITYAEFKLAEFQSSETDQEMRFKLIDNVNGGTTLKRVKPTNSNKESI